jgi:hypothetical protein
MKERREKGERKLVRISPGEFCAVRRSGAFDQLSFVYSSKLRLCSFLF